MKKSILILTFILSLTAHLAAQNTISIEASRELYPKDFAISSQNIQTPQNGVYPVQLKLTTFSADKTLYIKIFRSQNQAGPYSLIIDAMQPNEEYFYLYDSQNLEPGIKYYYQAYLGENTKSQVSTGWGALTHEALYVYVNKTLNKSYEKMTIMNKPSALAKLGSETSNGSISGTFSYNAKIKGMGGIATLSYSNYSDDGLITITGQTLTKSDMLMSGTMEGSLTITGMYNTTIDFSKVIIKDGKAGGGTYGIIPKGAPRKEISYTWNTDKARN